MPTVPDFLELCSEIERYTAQYAAARQEKSRGKRFSRVKGASPHRAPYRPQAALPPPHMGLTRKEVALNHARERDAELRLKRRTGEVAYIPLWGYRLAARVQGGLGWRELAQVPPEQARRIRLAASYAHTADKARAVMAVGLVLYWLSTRHPARPGKVSTIAGLPCALLAGLTRKRGGGHYSVSAVRNRNHGKSLSLETARGPLGGKVGDPEQDSAGMLALLEHAGALYTWTPLPHGLPAWMLGQAGFPALCIRAGARADVPSELDLSGLSAQAPPIAAFDVCY